MKTLSSIFFLSTLMCIALVSCTSQKENTKQNSTPEWTKGVVWYQIFPERFRNGDDSNDPSAGYFDVPESWNVSRWNSDWYARDEWEKEMGDSHKSSVTTRRYGGDLQGVIDKLPYLKELGVGAIYFNPVFDAYSMHKYDARYFHHIDRFFGPDPKGDTALFARENPDNPATWEWSSADSLFLQLIREAHSRNIKIVIDGVFNHTGTRFWAFEDLVKNQENSLYKDWYDVIRFDDPATLSENEFDYHGWWGFKGLPEFKEVDGNLVEPVKNHIFEITRRWMDPNGDGNPEDGVDGWRLDVAEEVGSGFWREWHALVRSLNPEAITIAEIWTDKATEYVSSDMFSAVMNYRFAYALVDFMIDEELSAGEFVSRLDAVWKSFPPDKNYSMQNLMDSHDTPRLASMIVNPGREYDREGHPEDGFNIRKPNQKERAVQKIIAMTQFMYPGSPMLYYGTEAGMWGADDPDDRKPMPWKDIRFDLESAHPLGEKRIPDDPNFDSEMFDFYKTLGTFHSNSDVLKYGKHSFIYTDDERQSFGLARFSENKQVLLFVNRSASQISISISRDKLPINQTKFTELFSGATVVFPDDSLRMTIAPLSGIILH